jgi:hypothetical protein
LAVSLLGRKEIVLRLVWWAQLSASKNVRMEAERERERERTFVKTQPTEKTQCVL